MYNSMNPKSNYECILQLYEWIFLNFRIKSSLLCYWQKLYDIFLNI